MKPVTSDNKPASKQRRARQRDGVRRKFMGQVELLQERLAAAENTWEKAKEQFNQAKRRRKLAKLFAKHAKKQAKRSAAKLDLARKTLADAKAQAMTISWRATPRKGGKTKNIVALSKRRSTPVQRARKAAVDTTKPISREPVVAFETQAEGIAGSANTAASLPKNPPDQV